MPERQNGGEGECAHSPSPAVKRCLRAESVYSSYLLAPYFRAIGRYTVLMSPTTSLAVAVKGPDPAAKADMTE